MAVESRFVVIRQGVEAKTFMDKKSADEYDKMLDMADNLADVFSNSSIELSDAIAEELSIYLAQNREEVLVALLAKKAAKKVAPKVAPKTAAKLESKPELKEAVTVESEISEVPETEEKAEKVAKKAPAKKSKPALAKAS
ncbi:MAG: YebG family protein [Colwellia sp.]